MDQRIPARVEPPPTPLGVAHVRRVELKVQQVLLLAILHILADHDRVAELPSPFIRDAYRVLIVEISEVRSSYAYIRNVIDLAKSVVRRRRSRSSLPGCEEATWPTTPTYKSCLRKSRDGYDRDSL